MLFLWLLTQRRREDEEEAEVEEERERFENGDGGGIMVMHPAGSLPWESALKGHAVLPTEH